MAGTVIEVGDGVTRFTEGDLVVSMCITDWIDGASLDWDVARPQGGPLPGVLAEYVVMKADWCVHAPRSLNTDEASTLPIAALTAWMALLELDHVRAGQTVVVQGTGGVSLFAVQFGVANGATVIVTTSTDAKANRVRQLGAHHIIDRSARPDWHTAVLELTDGRGADHVLEMVGGENFGRSVAAMKQGGRISLIGFLESTALSAPLMPLLAKRATIEAISVGPRRAMEDMIRAIDQHGIKPVVDTTYRFDQVPEAFEHLKRGAFGKIVVKPGGS